MDATTSLRRTSLRRRIAAIGLAIVLTVPAVTPVGAAPSETEIRLEGHGGIVLTASPSRRTAELRVPGRAPMRFENARIQLTRGRVYVAARDDEHTINGFSDRRTVSGKIGILTRIPGYDYARRDQKQRLRPVAEQWRVSKVAVANEKPRLSATRSSD